jgi:Tol biopolymer transport system component
MNPDGSQQRRITTAGLHSHPGLLSWMPGFDQVFYEESGSNFSIINLSSGSIVPWQPPLSVSGIPHFVDLSPDGSKLAYEDARPPSHDIFTINIDGTDHRQLTATEEKVQANHPSWSPEGDKLAFTVFGQEPQPSLWVMNADGSEKVKLADNVGAREPVWSPDGRKIAFECWMPKERNANVFDICLVNSDGTGLVNVTNLETQALDVLIPWAWHLTWSPNGTQISFYIVGGPGENRPDGRPSSQVYVINADGTGLTQLTFEGSNCCPAWSR